MKVFDVRSVMITVVSGGAIFGCIGAVIGCLIGSLAPGYYRAVMPRGDVPEFDPLQVGLALGISQGLVFGVVVTLAILALQAWREIKLAEVVDNENELKQPTTNSERSTVRPLWVYLLWGVGGASCLLFVGLTMLGIGTVMGNSQIYEIYTQRKLEKLEPILEQIDYEHLEINVSSAAQITLLGWVAERNSLKHLHNELVVTFGTEEAESMLRLVKVGEPDVWDDSR